MFLHNSIREMNMGKGPSIFDIKTTTGRILWDGKYYHVCYQYVVTLRNLLGCRREGCLNSVEGETPFREITKIINIREEINPAEHAQDESDMHENLAEYAEMYRHILGQLIVQTALEHANSFDEVLCEKHRKEYLRSHPLGSALNPKEEK